MKLIYSTLIFISSILLQLWHVSSACSYYNSSSGSIEFATETRRINSLKKCWVIKAPDDHLVYLTLAKLDLSDPYCDSAYIELLEDYTGRKEKLCSHNSYYSRFNDNKTIMMMGSVNMTITLKDTWNYVSFEVNYKTESVICTYKDHFRCSENQCIQPDKVCDGVEDCDNGLDESRCDIVRIKGAESSRNNSITWLKNHQINFGWGRNTHRAITSLYLTGAGEFRGKKLEEEIMVKQLQLQIATALLRNLTVPMTVNELSMYINALSVTCHDVRNLFGQDLLKILAERSLSHKTQPIPGAYLTLCNANWPIPHFYIRHLFSLINKETEYPFAFDIQAMTIMALSCIKEKTSNFLSEYEDQRLMNFDDIIETFMANQSEDGSFGNAHTTAFVTQALIASGQANSGDWNFDKAMQFLMKNLNSSMDFLSVYSTLPLFKNKTLMDIGKIDCSGHQRKLEEDQDILDIVDKLSGNVHVRFSLYIGDHKDVIHTLYLRVPDNSTVYDVMKRAQIADPKYKFSYHKSIGHVYIYEIAGISNDMEVGKFWLFFTTSNNQTYLEHETMSPDQIMIEDKEHLIMWYKTANI